MKLIYGPKQGVRILDEKHARDRLRGPPKAHPPLRTLGRCPETLGRKKTESRRASVVAPDLILRAAKKATKSTRATP